MTAIETPSKPTSSPVLEGRCHCGDVHWRFAAPVDTATACSCTLCRRYGALWIYDHAGSPARAGVEVTGSTRSYAPGNDIDFLFCDRCHCLAAWRGRRTQPDGRRRMAVNVRLADPAAVGHLEIEHLDGLDTWHEHRDGRRVADYWF